MNDTPRPLADMTRDEKQAELTGLLLELGMTLPERFLKPTERAMLLARDIALDDATERVATWWQDALSGWDQCVQAVRGEADRRG